MKQPILSIKNLSVSFIESKTRTTVVKDCSYAIFENEILGIVGESGSGKSVSSLAILGLLPKKKTSVTGSIHFEEKDLLTLPEHEIRAIRGKDIGMIFQEPMSALNPSMRCGDQVDEILRIHSSLNKSQRYEEVISLFKKVKLPNPERIYNSYPHEISGGQKQRVIIAVAIACKPKILIADEPTTALDVTVQKEIISLLKTLQKETKMSIIFISHDLSLVSEIADNLVVMYQGAIVEQGKSKTVFKSPKHPYTQALINAKPSLNVRLKYLPTIKDYIQKTFRPVEITPQARKDRHSLIYDNPPLLEIRDLEKEYFNKAGLFGKPTSFKAVDNVSFKLYESETLGLVGESGCGKSTLANAILQLDKATSGTIFYNGQDITSCTKKRLRSIRKDIQLIFQDPFSSLNPKIKIGDAISEPMKVHKILKSEKERKDKVLELLASVGLSEESYDKYPHEFSGGQRQRIGIARAIALQPKIIICDESVSALDISVQAQVLNLLNTLKDEFNFSYIFISHDLSVVKYMSDKLMVMNKGKIEEYDESDTIYSSPKSTYTKKLIDAIPKGFIRS